MRGDPDSEDIATSILRKVCDVYPVAALGLSTVIFEVERETRAHWAASAATSARNGTTARSSRRTCPRLGAMAIAACSAF